MNKTSMCEKMKLFRMAGLKIIFILQLTNLLVLIIAKYIVRLDISVLAAGYNLLNSFVLALPVVALFSAIINRYPLYETVPYRRKSIGRDLTSIIEKMYVVIVIVQSGAAIIFINLTSAIMTFTMLILSLNIIYLIYIIGRKKVFKNNNTLNVLYVPLFAGFMTGFSSFYMGYHRGFMKGIVASESNTICPVSFWVLLGIQLVLMVVFRFILYKIFKKEEK